MYLFQDPVRCRQAQTTRRNALVLLVFGALAIGAILWLPTNHRVFEAPGPVIPQVAWEWEDPAEQTSVDEELWADTEGALDDWWYSDSWWDSILDPTLTADVDADGIPDDIDTEISGASSEPYAP